MIGILPVVVLPSGRRLRAGDPRESVPVRAGTEIIASREAPAATAALETGRRARQPTGSNPTSAG